MKREDFWWIDGNNNKWDADLYTEDEAEKCSKSLTNCDNCINCRNCVNCDSCIRCDSCINCDNCINCDSCNGYIANPSMYITQNIGSRNDQTIFYYGKTNKGMSVQIRCGCFHGNLKEFAEAVEKTHGDNKYGEQYRKEIEKVKALFELEGEKMNKIEKGRITETMLGREDHGIMTLYLLIEFEKSTYAYGGYALDTYDEKEGKRIGATLGIQAIAEILNCVGVTKWEDLTGSFVRCEHQEKGGKIIRIGNLIEDKWFSFEAFFKETKEVVENE